MFTHVIYFFANILKLHSFTIILSFFYVNQFIGKAYFRDSVIIKINFEKQSINTFHFF